MVPDRELMERMKADDTGALEELILRWRERAESYAVSILHDPHLVYTKSSPLATCDNASWSLLGQSSDRAQCANSH